jgi:probable rRNA maturation factor
MKVEIRMERGTSDGALRGAIRRAAEATLANGVDPSPASLTVLVTDDDAVRDFNSRFTGTDAPTDVLSFPAGSPEVEEEDRYLGDIVISLETARRQAEAGGHRLVEEVELLSVHGILHLLGHDHAEPDGKTAMWTAQAAVLAALGNPLSPP